MKYHTTAHKNRKAKALIYLTLENLLHFILPTYINMQKNIRKK